MQTVFDQSASKKPTNLSLNSDLLAKAKSCGINLSQTLEKALVAEIARKEQERWLAENQQALEKLNQFADQQGLFSDEFRVL